MFNEGPCLSIRQMISLEYLNGRLWLGLPPLRAFWSCSVTTQEYTRFRLQTNEKGERVYDHMTSADRMKALQEQLGDDALIMLIFFWR